MMKRIIVFLLCLTVSALFILSVSANAPLVSDSTGSLTSEQIQSLISHSQELGEIYGVDIVILLEDDYVYDPQDRAEEYYDDNGFSDNGIIFYLSLYDRDWYMATTGECIDTLSEYRIGLIFEEIKGDLADNDFYTAFDTFLFLCGEYLEQGHTQDFPEFVDDVFSNYANETRSFGEKIIGYIFKLIIVIPIAFVIALIIVNIEKKKMNNATLQANADLYVIKGSLELEKEQDIYTNTTISKVPINTGSSSGGRSRSGGGGGGRSHGGRGGKF